MQLNQPALLFTPYIPCWQRWAPTCRAWCSLQHCCVWPIPFLACDSSRTSFIAHLMADSFFFGSRERGVPARTKARYALRRPAQLTVPMKPAIAAALRKGSIRWMARARACEGIEVDVWSRKSQEGQR